MASVMSEPDSDAASRGGAGAAATESLSLSVCVWLAWRGSALADARACRGRCLRQQPRLKKPGSGESNQ